MNEVAATAVLLNRSHGARGEVAATAGVDIIPEVVHNMSLALCWESVAERVFLW